MKKLEEKRFLFSENLKTILGFFHLNHPGYAGLSINWTTTPLFITPGTLPTLDLPIKFHPSSRSLFFLFVDVVLVSNYYGCKREAIKLIPYYMIDIICKTVKPPHLKKLQIIQI